MTVLLHILKWNQIKNGTIKIFKGDFPGGPVVKTLPSTAWGMGLMPGQGTKHSTCLKKKKKKKKDVQRSYILENIVKWMTQSTWKLPQPWTAWGKQYSFPI